VAAPFKTVTVNVPTLPHEGGFAFANVPAHGRTFDFRVLGHIGWPFARAVAASFEKWAGGVGRATAGTRFQKFMYAMDWMHRHPSSAQVAALLSSLASDHRTATHDQWNEALAVFRAQLIKEKGREATQYIQNMKGMLTALAQDGVVPPDLHLRWPKRFGRQRGAKKSVAEAASKHAQKERKKALDAVMATLPASERTSEARAVIANLMRERDGEDFPTDPRDVKRAILEMNDGRLQRIRDAAESRLARDYERFRATWALVEDATTNGTAGYAKELLSPVGPRWREAAARRVTMDRMPDDIALAHLLAVIGTEHGGFVRGKRRPSVLEAELIQRFGGAPAVEAYFHPTYETVVAALVIVLVDTGLNVSVLHELRTDGVQRSERPGHLILRGRKGRAGGAQIEAEVPIVADGAGIAAGRAVEIVLELTERARALPITPDHERAFVFISRPFGGNGGMYPRLPSGRAILQAFRVLQSDAGIAERYSLDMIRPSVLMGRSGRAGGSLAIAQALADHRSMQTTRTYADRFANRLEHEASIREFQNRFQQVVIHEIDGVSDRLGISPAEAEALFGDAMRTGLGLACRGPRLGVQPGTKPGEPCTKQERCVGCSQAIFVATPQNTLDLLMVQRYLADRQAEWESTQPATWLAVWLPWVVFAQVVVEKMDAEPGKLRTILHEAQKAASRLPVPETLELFMSAYFAA
jgi:hypothetical protein